MQIDSARGLKASFLSRFPEMVSALAAPRAAAARGGGSMLAFSATPMSRLAGLQRSVAVGLAPVGRKQVKLAIRLQREAMREHPEVEKLVARAKGEVDLRYVGRIEKRALPWHQSRLRPLRIGGSIGHYAITAGSIGCFARTAQGGLRLLSNNHVLADENRGRKGDAVLQPGAVDGGRRKPDRVGSLDRFVRLKRGGVNLVDAALALIDDGLEWDEFTIGTLGKLAGVRPTTIFDGEIVHKAGRTTGQTQGTVTAFELDNVVVSYDVGNIRFDDQIEIEGSGTHAFSDGGDSGSLIVDDDRLAAALLFAGGTTGGSNGKGLTYANPIAAVLSAFSITIG